MSLSQIQIQNQLEIYIKQKGPLINNKETAIQFSNGKTYLIYTNDKGQITNATRKEPNNGWIETVKTFFAKMFETRTSDRIKPAYQQLQQIQQIQQHNIRGLDNGGVNCFMNAAIQSISKDEWIELLRPERRDDIERNAKEIIESRFNSRLITIEEKEISISTLKEELKKYDLFMKESAPTIKRWISGENVSSWELRKSILSGINRNHKEVALWGNDGYAKVQGDSREFLGLLNGALLLKYTDGIHTKTKISSATRDCEMFAQDPEPSCDVKVPVIQQDMSGNITGELNSLTQAFKEYLSPDPRPDFKWEGNATSTDTQGQIIFHQLPKKIMVDLKRDSALGNKSNHRIEIDTLSLTDSSGKTKKYTCAAAICHTGNQGGGHYYSFRMIDGEWYKFNDSKVNKAPNKEAMDDININAVHVSMHETVGDASERLS